MTMKATPNKKKPSQASRPRKRRSRGVPTALVAALLVIALFFGGLAGFVVANKTNTYREQLASANERVTELENILTMMGFSEDTDPTSFVFDDSDNSDEIGDLSGSTGDDGSVLWNEDGFISGLLADTGEPVIVAEFNGGELLSSEVVEPYNEQYANEAFGFNDAEENSSDTLQSVMEMLVADKICRLKAEELGLTELTAEDEAAIRAEEEEYFQEQKDFFRDSVDTSGMTAEEADAAVTQYLETEVGITLDDLIASESEDYWYTKLFNEVTKDVTATDEEIQASYDALLADQQQRFAEYPDEYEFAIMNGETLVYNLEGYRYVKHILLTFDDPETATAVEDLYYQISELDPETDFDQISQLQQQLDPYYTDLKAKAEEVLAELQAGADFDELVEKYGEDEGMKYEPTKSEGYRVSAESNTLFSSEFIEGCMMLENPGDVSTPVCSVGGVHIIQYVGDVTPGAVPLESVRDTIEAEVLADKQESSFVEQEAQWIAAADVKYYPERLQ